MTLKHDTDIIKLNVGGYVFTTLKSTLLKPICDFISEQSLLTHFINDTKSFGHKEPKIDENGALFIDRNPEFFKYILDYLRMDENDFELPDEEESLRGIIRDAQFYKIDALKEIACDKLYTLWFPNSFLHYEQKKDLIGLCKFPVKTKWRMIYKASIDGFASLDFHSKCDGHKSTLTVVKTKKNFIFGGYTDATWSHSSGYKTDKNSFIFSLVNDDNPACLPCTKPSCAIYCNIAHGPTFGDGHDIFIENNSNLFCNSYANLGDSYKHSLFGVDSKESKTFLAGSIEFQTKDIEVYTKI